MCWLRLWCLYSDLKSFYLGTGLHKSKAHMNFFEHFALDICGHCLFPAKFYIEMNEFTELNWWLTC